MNRWMPIVALAAALMAVGLGYAAAPSDATREIILAAPPVAVHDGDTFDADLDGDGRLELPRERVRLLFVDTPELHESPKGQDLRHGLPAKAALAALLERAPLVLRITPGNERDIHGRTLARVLAAGEDLSLELVRQGHSAFDTRFAFPPDYDAFVRAEAEAFDTRRGIWREDNSRAAYLERLRKEGRTPETKANPWFLPGVFPAQSLDGNAALGHYVKVEGQVVENRGLRGGHRRLRLLRGGARAPLTVFVHNSRAMRVGVERWPSRASVRVEGFMERYRDRIELRLQTGSLK